MSAIPFRVLPKRQHVNDPILHPLVSKWLTVALFVVPGMMLFLTFLLIPIAQSSVFSLYKWNGFGPLEDFRLFQNYELLFKDKVFLSSVLHSVVLIILSLIIQLPLSLSLALLVGRGELPGRRIFRTILFIPYVFSEVITAIIWLYVLNPRNGLMNVILALFIPNYENIGMLGDPDLALFGVFMVLTWKYFGFHMILYMAGLQGIPKDLEEAARVDGAREWDVLRYITLPMLSPTLRLTIYLSIVGALQQFTIVWVMTTGGPVNSTQTIATYLFKFGIQRFAPGYGSAVAVVLFTATFVFSLLYQRYVMRER